MHLTEERSVGAVWNEVDVCTDVTIYDPIASGLAEVVFRALVADTTFDLEWFHQDSADLVATRISGVEKRA